MASHSSDLTISVYGHPSANPESVATLFGGKQILEADGSEDVAIFVINPNSGVDEQTIANWGALDDFQTPRLIVVTELESGKQISTMRYCLRTGSSIKLLRHTLFFMMI
jgi:hypothetical protein